MMPPSMTLGASLVLGGAAGVRIGATAEPKPNSATAPCCAVQQHIWAVSRTDSVPLAPQHSFFFLMQVQALR